MKNRKLKNHQVKKDIKNVKGIQRKLLIDENENYRAHQTVSWT